MLRRPGGITLEQIREVVPEVQRRWPARSAADEPQLAPGQLTRHYAPRGAADLI